MPLLVIGGTGFIGTRVIRRLAARGEEVAVMDINPGAASFDDLDKQVRVTRGDVTQFDDVMRTMIDAKPARVINLSYFLGSEHAPHVAMKLNILGMDNCFEAAQLCGVQRVVVRRPARRLCQFGGRQWPAKTLRRTPGERR